MGTSSLEKNRYSYAHNGYQARQRIDLSQIKAIGIPSRQLRTINQAEQVEIYLTSILTLMKKYSITLPIIDTSAYNTFLSFAPTN